METGRFGTHNIASAIALSFIAVATFLVLPVFIGACVAELGLSEEQVGWLGSCVMGGSALGPAIMMLVVRRVNWRIAMRATLALLLIATCISMLTRDKLVFVLLQPLAALGGGAAYSLALTVLSDGRHPDRYFGFSVAAQVSFQVVGMLLFPGVVGDFGLNGLLGVFVALQLAGLLLTQWIPETGKQFAGNVDARGVLRPATLLALFGCFFFFFNVGVLWTYIERMAALSGFDASRSGNILAIGVAFGIPGAIAASWCGERFGRLGPIALGTLGTVLSLAMLGEGMSVAAFTIGAILYNLVWNFSLTFQYAAVNAVDDCGSGVAAAPAFHGAGGAVGPAVAATLVGPFGMDAASWLAAAAVVLSLLLFAASAWLRRRSGSLS